MTARYFSIDRAAQARLEAESIEIIPSRFGDATADSNASHDELQDLLFEAEAVIRGLAPIDAKLIASSRRLRVISIRGVGTDGIDLVAAKERGVMVTITPGALDQAVAEYAVALMMGLARNVTANDRAVRQGIWEGSIGTELFGSSVGIVGLGRIGKEVAAKCRKLGMRVFGYTRTPDIDWSRKSGIELVGLNELLASSDIVSLHCSLNPQTRHLIGGAELGLMKRSAFLINTARGAIVDEQALVEALDSGRIAGAALDVVQLEPLAVDHPIRQLTNVILSPHVSAFTRNSLIRSNNEAVANVIAVLGGRPLPAGVQVV